MESGWILFGFGLDSVRVPVGILVGFWLGSRLSLIGFWSDSGWILVGVLVGIRVGILV